MTTTHAARRARKSTALCLAVLGASTAIVLTGCVPGGSAATGGTVAAGPGTPVTPKIDSKAKIDLTVWTVEDSRFEAQKQLTASFEQKYPNVHVDLVQKPSSDYDTQVKLALTGRNAPDVVEGNNGFSLDAALVKGKLIRPLDKYAKALGWLTRYTPNLRRQWELTPDGQNFGSGLLYGTGMVGELGGWYYNKAKLKALGAQLPKTASDFDALLAKAKAANQVPIMLGNIDGWPATHMYNMVNDQTAKVGDLQGIAYTDRAAKWTSPEFVKSAETLAGWVKDGYLANGYNGYSQDDAVAKFVAGTGLFMQCGSWCTPAMEKGLGDNVGFILPPPVKAGGISRSTGGISRPFHVTTATKNPDAAVLYIDWITNEGANELFTKNGDLPGVTLNAEPAGMSPLADEVFKAYETVRKNDALMPYPDWSLPMTGSVYYEKMQELMAGKTSASDALAAVQANRITYFDQQGVK